MSTSIREAFVGLVLAGLIVLLLPSAAHSNQSIIDAVGRTSRVIPVLPAEKVGTRAVGVVGYGWIFLGCANVTDAQVAAREPIAVEVDWYPTLTRVHAIATNGAMCMQEASASHNYYHRVSPHDPNWVEVVQGLEVSVTSAETVEIPYTILVDEPPTTALALSGLAGMVAIARARKRRGLS